MENKTPENENLRPKTTFLDRVAWSLRSFWRMLANNVWLKVLSLLLAILLWNYVISSNTSITRSKTIAGLTGYVTGQTTLNANRLALLDDPTEDLSNITVTVDAPQAYYARLSGDNIQVSLDLSSVRTAGTQEVPLRASSSYGRVTDIVPDSLTLTFEALDSRSVPINSVLSGDMQENYWYNITRMNPSSLTVSGAGSVVRNIGSATVYVDITGHDSPFTQAQPYVLLDPAGEEISAEMLNLSSSSVSVSVDIYPTKELPVSTDLANVVAGQPAEGYVVQSVSQSFTERATITPLSGVKNLSSEQVYVNVTISEASIGGHIDNVSVLVAGKGEGLSVEYNTMSVYVTGPRSVVEQLQNDGVFVSVDLTGLKAGTYEIEPVFDNERFPNVTFQPEHEKMTVTLTEVGNDE